MKQLIISYDIDSFKDDDSGLSDEQLEAVLDELDGSMDYSMIDEHIRSEFYDLAEKMFPEVFQ